MDQVIQSVVGRADERHVEHERVACRLAGPSALLVAKLHKLAERTQEPEAKRLKDKDALDVLRILRAIPINALAEGLGRLRADSLAGEVTREAIAHLGTLFGSVSAAGTEMAIRAVEYFPNTQTLQVVLRNGGVYQYFDVPEQVSEEFIKADSPGTYFNSAIKGLYRYVRV